jgi:hypothetical protein
MEKSPTSCTIHERGLSVVLRPITELRADARILWVHSDTQLDQIADTLKLQASMPPSWLMGNYA